MLFGAAGHIVPAGAAGHIVPAGAGMPRIYANRAYATPSPIDLNRTRQTETSRAGGAA